MEQPGVIKIRGQGKRNAKSSVTTQKRQNAFQSGTRRLHGGGPTSVPGQVGRHCGKAETFRVDAKSHEDQGIQQAIERSETVFNVPERSRIHGVHELLV